MFIVMYKCSTKWFSFGCLIVGDECFYYNLDVWLGGLIVIF